MWFLDWSVTEVYVSISNQLSMDWLLRLLRRLLLGTKAILCGIFPHWSFLTTWELDQQAQWSTLSFTQEREGFATLNTILYALLFPNPRAILKIFFVCMIFCALMMLDFSHYCRSPGVRIYKTLYGSSSQPWCIEFDSVVSFAGLTIDLGAYSYRGTYLLRA